MNDHYKMEKCEAIDFVDQVLCEMERMTGRLSPKDAYCVKDALKYAVRAGRKGDWREDARKCADYLVRLKTGSFGSAVGRDGEPRLRTTYREPVPATGPDCGSGCRCGGHEGLEEVNVQVDEGAFVPLRAHADDAGLDLRTPDDIMLFQDDMVVVDTGVHVEIPKGYVGMIKSKSGLNVNYGITAEGVIDAGYAGSIVVKLYSNGDDYRFERGDKIAQLVIMPVVTPKPVVVASIEGGERGDAGFGSTGR